MNLEEFFSSVDSVNGWMRLTHAKWFWDNAKDWTLAAELGSYCGRSACAAGLSIRRHGSKARYWCVDTFDVPSRKTCFEEFTTNIGKFGLNDIIVPVVGDSHSKETIESVPDKLDFLYIDAAHDYESVRKDIELWAPKVKVGGVVMFHDYCADIQRYNTGVKQAVDEAVGLHIIEAPMNIDDEACVISVKL